MHAAYHGYIKRFGVLNAIFSRINRKFVPSATGSYLVLLEGPARPAILEGSLAHSVVKSIDPGLLEALGWNNWMLEILEYDCERTPWSSAGGRRFGRVRRRWRARAAPLVGRRDRSSGARMPELLLGTLAREMA